MFSLRFNIKNLYQYQSSVLKTVNIIKTVHSFTPQNFRTLLTSSESSLDVLEEDIKSSTKNPNKYTNRLFTCGELRRENVGENVILCGWLEFKRMNKFIVLRDGYGQIQLLVKENDLDSQRLISDIPLESVLKVKGKVVSRPKDMINKKLPTGEIEILIDNLKLLNRAKDNLPFNIREFQKAKEPLRMQYRYLDLRFLQMQRNIRFRSKLLMKMREFLINNHFVDVETPTLFKATPGGAQEFIVPTRFPGQFYSLVQSPQQFKQILMGGSIDRYFQIARCYRDEGARSDRQPEFTQLDIEMSFTSVEGVIKLIEDLVEYCLKNNLRPDSPQFKRISYNEAMEKYGSDKPDISFNFELKNCTDVLKKNSMLITSDDFGAYFLAFPEEYINQSKKVKEIIHTISSTFGLVKLVQHKLKNQEEFVDKMGRLLNKNVAAEFLEQNSISGNSLLFLAFGNKKDVLSLLGKIRTEYVNFLETLGITIRKRGLHFLWVVDFPLFEISETDGCLQSAHHPFTSPHPDDLHFLEKEPLKVRALAYDLVLNGHEVGGGSIRIHDAGLQEMILRLLNIDTDALKHMLEMLGSGCPPHGGIALGLDRLLSILLGATSIRDVIAFPKNYEGRDPISGAPSHISDSDKKLYHIETVITEEKTL